MAVTSFYAGLLALMFVVLSIRVVAARRRPMSGSATAATARCSGASGFTATSPNMCHSRCC